MHRILLRVAMTVWFVLTINPVASPQDPAAQERMDLARKRHVLLQVQQDMELRAVQAKREARLQGADPSRFVRIRRLTAERIDELSAVGFADHDDDTLLLDKQEEDAVVPQRGVARLSLASFEGWIFGNMTTEAMRHDWLKSALDEKIAKVTRNRRLNPEHVAKIRLAGQGDIKRFFDRVGNRRLQFEETRQDIKKAIDLLNTMESVCYDFEHGPFGVGSLYAKTLWKISLEIYDDPALKP